MSKNKLRLALLYGGKSGEHEISLLSAASVFKALDSTRYDIVLIGCDKKGRWYRSSSLNGVLSENSQSLKVKTPSSKLIDLCPKLFECIDVVLPIMHGPLYEDGCLQGFLELCDVAYVGSGHLSSALSMDKVIAKQMVLASGIKIAEFITLHSSDTDEKTSAQLEQLVSRFSFPLFVKPACLGSSVGVHQANNKKDLLTAIEDAFSYDEKLLIERGIKGREIELAVLKVGTEIKVSLAGEIEMNNKRNFYSYAAKYLEKDAVCLHVPAVLEETELAQLQQAAVSVFNVLGCDGLARVDFFLEEGTNEVIFNEINTLPGFTEISMYPKLWEASGLSYTALLDTLIMESLNRFQRRNRLVRDFL